MAKNLTKLPFLPINTKREFKKKEAITETKNAASEDNSGVISTMNSNNAYVPKYIDALNSPQKPNLKSILISTILILFINFIY